jgi:hypothetical protein
VSYLTRPVQAIASILGFVMGDGYVLPLDEAMQSDSNSHLIW